MHIYSAQFINMSRWTNKNRLHGFAFPLDSLVKEKENTNRPVAARSAGTVGKWGTTSFTSIRTPSYGNPFVLFFVCLQLFIKSSLLILGYVAYSNPDTLNPSTSPLSGDGSLTPHAYSVPDAPKPRKFFKSRNTVAMEPSLFQASPNAHQSSASSAIHTSPFGGSSSYTSTTTSTATTTERQRAPKIRLKINKKQLLVKSARSVDASLLPPPASKPPKLPKPPKVKKPPKPMKEKPVKMPKAIVEPTRKLSRQRKAVNYSENHSRSPTPRREIDSESEVVEEEVVIRTNDVVVVPTVEESSFVSEAESMGPRSPSVAPTVSEEDTTTMADSSAEIVEENKDHPPIVLRISKVSG